MNSQEKIETFVALTGTNASTAEAFLRSHDDNLEAAVNTFLEAGIDAIPPQPTHQPIQQGQQQRRGTTDNDDDEEEEEEADDDGNTPAAAAAAASGDKDGKDKDILSRILDKADQVKPTSEEEKQKEKKKNQIFKGTGYSLSGPGGAVKEHVDAKTVTDADPEPREYRLTLWKDGYSVDGGELHSYDTPEGKDFMEDMDKGYAPKMLRSRDAKGRPIPVNITLEDRREEMAPPPEKPKFKAFSGQGQSLSGGSGAAAATTTTTASISAQSQQQGYGGIWATAANVAGWMMGSSSAAATTTTTTTTIKGATASSVVTVDKSKPVTTIQVVRGPDGSRKAIEVNTSHTVRDLASLCSKEFQVDGTRPCQIVSGFPPKPVENVEQTVAEAQLCNAVVTLRVG